MTIKMDKKWYIRYLYHTYFALEYNELNNTCYFSLIYMLVIAFKTLGGFSSSMVLS